MICRTRSKRRCLSVAAALVACLGCDDRGTEVRSYSVPKEQLAVVPVDHGPQPSLVLPSGTMQWDLPAGWTNAANTNPMRFATLNAGTGDEQVEVAITQLGGAAGGIAANINRWRGQVGLPPASDEQLAADMQRIESPDAPGVLIDLIGPTDESPRMLAAIFPTETHTWFVKTMGPRPVLERHRSAFVDLCETVRFSGGLTQPTTTPPPAPSPSPGGAAPAWGELPVGWTADPAPKAMSVASLTVSDGMDEASLTITPLGGDQDLLANVNRWRRQVGLGPLADLSEAEPVPVEVAGEPGRLVDIGGSEVRTLGVVSTRGPTTWFYKLTGPDRLVAGQRDAFETFVRSIRFKGDTNE